MILSPACSLFTCCHTCHLSLTRARPRSLALLSLLDPKTVGSHPQNRSNTRTSALNVLVLDEPINIGMILWKSSPTIAGTSRRAKSPLPTKSASSPGLCAERERGSARRGRNSSSSGSRHCHHFCHLGQPCRGRNSYLPRRNEWGGAEGREDYSSTAVQVFCRWGLVAHVVKKQCLFLRTLHVCIQFVGGGHTCLMQECTTEPVPCHDPRGHQPAVFQGISRAGQSLIVCITQQAAFLLSVSDITEPSGTFRAALLLHIYMLYLE